MRLPTDYQYVLTREKAWPFDEFETVELGDQTLLLDPRFRRFDLKTASGEAVGLVFGFPYSTTRQSFLLPGAEISAVIAPVDTVEAFEEGVYPDLGGCFVVITWGQLGRRVYPDQGGGIPIVYDLRTGSLAATTWMLFDEVAYETRFNRSLYDSVVRQEGRGAWISGYHTAHTDIKRLLPNHFLDLDTMTARRFWPKASDFNEWMPIEEAATTVARHMTDFTTSMFQCFDVVATLTAGYDSRMMLASSREIRDRAKFFTMEGSAVDQHVSARLAADLGLSHQCYPIVHSSDREKAIWDRAVGDTVRETNRDIFPTLLQIRGSDFIATGMYGEVGRCRLYRQDIETVNNSPLAPEIVLSRLTLPRTPEISGDIDQWLKALSGLPNSVTLDLAFHELKFGSWSAGQAPIQSAIKFNFYPFALRPVIRAFLQTDPAEKTTNRLFDACIAKAWPELQHYPLNKFGDYRDKMTTLKKIFVPGRVKRYLRDRFARYV